MRLVPPVLLIFLCACGAWPDLPRDEAGLPDGYPPLIPTASIPDQEAGIGELRAASESLEARAARLRARAAILSGAATDDAAREDIRRRLDPQD